MKVRILVHTNLSRKKTKKNSQSDMNRIFTMTFFLLTLPLLSLSGQVSFRVMSYNVENLFDTNNNPATADEEFLPSGNRHWTNGRYYHKLQQIAKVISAAGEWDTPALVGLCEVENDSVLLHLLNRTPLRQQHYRYQMTHGSDTRGINTVLLYQRDKFQYLGHTEYPVRFSHYRHKKTRNLLHVWGNVMTGIILDVFVCHFPSRYGGEKESEADRFDAARTLRELCDSLYQIRPVPQILIMGDFNDTPDDISIREKLGASPLQIPLPSTPDFTAIRPELHGSASLSLFNLFSERKTTPPGSHKYQGEWSQLDQFIISSTLADTTASMHLIPESARIFSPPFLLTPDKTWRGMRPFRTYYGFKYEAGYSDHLPILADFLFRK